MPITLPPLSRRRFLKQSMVGGAAVLVCRAARAEIASVDPYRFALMGDTHIAGDKTMVMRGVNLSANLAKACRQIVTQDPRPAAAAVLGDCALLDGQSADYVTLADLLGPVRAAGMPVHLVLGNHDDRDHFWTTIPAAAGQDKIVVNRHITLVESPGANWYMLDSLQDVNKSPGALGEVQLRWLDSALGKRTDKPALIVTHHNPLFGDKGSGLADTPALYTVLRSHGHVKAHFFGHTHTWDVKAHDSGIQLINLPPVAYTFGKGKPSGWIDVRLKAGGASVQLKSLDPTHPQHDQLVEVAWRT